MNVEVQCAARHPRYGRCCLSSKHEYHASLDGLRWHDKDYDVSASSNTCAECNTSPCDCEKLVWDYRYRDNRNGSTEWSHSTPLSRAAACNSLNEICKDRDRSFPHFIFGPVQRVIERPWEFEKASLSPKPEKRCAKGEHVVMHAIDAERLECERCGEVLVSHKTLSVFGFKKRAHSAGYDSARNALADECQSLKDELNEVLAENARLRRGKP